MGKGFGTVCAAIVLSLGAAAAPAFAASGPFVNFAGSWTGAGKVSIKDGTQERLRCKARYSVSQDGYALQQNLVCASDSYKFNIISNILSTDGTLSGTWAETSRNASGQITGRISAKQITAFVQGTGFTAGVGIASHGGRQSVEIRPTGTDVTDVSVTMEKQ